MNQQQKGAVACGHPVTAAAAEEILLDGGNAVDAVIAAALAACVAEPVLASLAGGGFLLFASKDRPPEVFDFFVQTPRNRRKRSRLDFYPITANFGKTSQEFHIGQGAVATPGVAKGLWEIHKTLSSMPMRRLAEPAVQAANRGVEINRFQSYIFDLVEPIYLATQESRASYTSDSSALLKAGDTHYQPALANTLERYASEGADLFYRGDLAQRLIHAQSKGGGQLDATDLEHYQVHRRTALSHKYRNVSIYTNPPPSSGGALILFVLALLEPLVLQPEEFGGSLHMASLTRALALTDQSRVNMLTATDLGAGLDPTLLSRYRKEILPLRKSLRGTTHISVIDRSGNLAAMTLSNGEGCGCMIPGSGVMLNNMLGEEDINPEGFQQWQPDQRLTSMMAPTILQWQNHRRIALGSGGSSRIRSAICQVISNLIDFELPLTDAVEAARLHVEGNQLDLEPGIEIDERSEIPDQFETKNYWQHNNLFFGGVHSVQACEGTFSASGDPRRGGIGRVL